MPVVMDAERISRALTRIAHEILEHNRGLADLALVGVRSRGVPIAQRIAADIKQITKEDGPRLTLDAARSGGPFPRSPDPDGLCLPRSPFRRPAVRHATPIVRLAEIRIGPRARRLRRQEDRC